MKREALVRMLVWTSPSVCEYVFCRVGEIVCRILRFDRHSMNRSTTQWYTILYRNGKVLNSEISCHCRSQGSEYCHLVVDLNRNFIC